MKKIFVCSSILVFFAAVANAQVLPAKIKKYLDNNYTSDETGPWKQAPGACSGNKSILIGDFNGDGRTDYLVRILTGKFTRNKSLHLIAFINKNSDYTPDPFFEDEYNEDAQNSATLIIKKGTYVNSGPNEDSDAPSFPLKTDAVAQYICETDQSVTYAYKDGEFKTIYAGSLLDKPPVVPDAINPGSVLTTPLPVSPDVIGNKDLTGTWAVYQPNGTLTTDANIFIRKRGATYDIIGSFASGNLGSDNIGSVKNGVISFDQDMTPGTVDAGGATVRFSSGLKWVRKDSVLPAIFAKQMSEKWPFVTPDITGRWRLKNLDKPNEQGDAIEFFDQVGTSIKVRTDGRAYPGYTAEDAVFIIEAMGAIEPGGNVIRLRGGNYLIREGTNRAIPRIKFLEVPKLERQCQEMLNGKVVRDKTGIMVWGDKVDPLCTGTPDPVAAVDCYKAELRKGSAAEDGVKTCSYLNKFYRQNILPLITNLNPSPTPTPNPPLKNPPVTDLSGVWLIFGSNGKMLPQTTGTVTFKDGNLWFEIKTSNTVKRATAYMDKGVLHSGWGTTATLSSDSQRIIWSDGTVWKRQ